MGTMKRTVCTVLATLALAGGTLSASAADYSEFPTGKGATSGAWNVQHSGRSADSFRYLLIACSNGLKFKIKQTDVDPCSKGATQYHIPSGCSTQFGYHKGPKWVNTNDKRQSVALYGAGCRS